MKQLRYLTIKPNIYCSYDCPYCSSRQLLFKSSTDYRLGLDDWSRVFKEANRLGTTYLDISGGEPLMYKPLPALVWEAKRLGWYVSINTTGIDLENKLDELENVRLDKACISLMSLSPELNDGIRQGDGGLKRTMTAIDSLRDSSIHLALHFILSRQNYHELPELIRFAFSVNASSLSFVYPENDHNDHNLLMTTDDIKLFMEDVLPVAISTYRQLAQHHGEFPVLFPDHPFKADYSKGIYWDSASQVKIQCDKPDTFLLIYPNGDVLPCNGIEYAHEPIVGNVLKESLSEIWQGCTIEKFREDRIPYCLNCPMKRHTGIGVQIETIPPYTEDVVRYVPSGLSETRPNVREIHLGTRVKRGSYMAPVTTNTATVKPSFSARKIIEPKDINTKN